MIDVTYHNPARLDYGAYQIEAITIDGVAVKFDRVEGAARRSIERCWPHCPPIDLTPST